MDLPNEITLMILEYLPKYDLKHVRLVCKLLASLAAKSLIETLYISPRSKDMDVFDGVTRHPEFSKSVKHLFYDTALFVEYDMKEYFNQLCAQFNRTRYTYLRIANTAVKDLIGIINGSSVECVESKVSTGAEGLERCKEEAAFVEGFHQYIQMARERNSILSDSWLARACAGLDCLGTIESVTLDNNWRTTLVKIPTDDIEARIDQNANDYGPDTSSDDPNTEDLGGWSGHEDSINDKQPTGSPVARAWPPTSLLPIVPTCRRHHSDLESMCKNGSFAFFRVVQLLKMTGKRPVEITAARQWYDSSGMPPYVFYPNRPFSTELSYFQNTLKVLQLQIAAHEYGGTKRRCPNLQHLKSFLTEAVALKQLQLELPYGDGTATEDGGPLYYNFAQVLPSNPGWRLPCLRDLELRNLSGSYQQFVGLFFSSLPELLRLRVSDLLLTGGRWEDIIEGISKLMHLEDCQLEDPLLHCRGRVFTCRGKYDVSSDEHEKFMAAISRYVVHGGRHPSLCPNVCENAATRVTEKSLDKVRMTLSELQAA